MASTLLFDFTTPESNPAEHWRSVDDVVMGGTSDSRFVAIETGAAFTGSVSLEQGGGFASVRSSDATWDLSAYDGFTVRLRGDGKRYWLTSYLSSSTLSYRAPLDPPQSWTTKRVPFETLVAYRRGSRIPDAPQFDASHLRAVGFLIADEQAGPFRLEVEWIRAGRQS